MTTDDPMTTQTSLAGDGSNELGYGAALTELESILENLETSAVDVDHLAEQVGRAAVLIAYCRDRLETVEADVAAVVEGLGDERGQPPAGPLGTNIDEGGSGEEAT